MCMKRESDDCVRVMYPFPMFDFVDLTMDDLLADDNGIIEINPLDYPYDLLPSEEEARDFNRFTEDSDEDLNYAGSITTNDSSNEINQNINTSNAASVNINFNIAETGDNGQSSEERTFELNVPQILLSMSRISNNLFERGTTSHD